ncbi:unannotated protein [freshwater metagenome]|uniref:Unannotated protein n=1 Tax=freshwater metagenome TaxID=449393 RepID=A0A6J6FK05_9ZZZZ
MNGRRLRVITRWLVAGAVVVGASTGLASASSDEPVTTGPTVLVGRGEVEPGGSVRLTINGFDSPWVTMSVCGNEARRGSGDCDLPGSVSNEFNDDSTTMIYNFQVGTPPTDCPCVIRVVGRDGREVAQAPIVLTGHPVGPIIDPPEIGQMLELDLVAKVGEMPGLAGLRSQLGGETRYDVTIAVRNTSNSPLQQVRLSGSAGRDASDNLTELPFDDPGLIAVGQTWQQTVSVVVPAPSFGGVQWRATASNAGPPVDTTITTQHRPWLLILLVLTAATALVVVLLRWLVRRRAERDQGKQGTQDEASSQFPGGGPQSGVFAGAGRSS